jgi:GNAT superfamily N-acetyltransferase
MSRFHAPTPLTGRHELSHFSCRSPEQTHWLINHARQAQSIGTTRVFVVTPADHPGTVVAFYAWCMASVTIGQLPERFRRGSGRYPQPVALLARLGVDEAHEGHGLGAALLLDVILRVVNLSEAIGCRGLLVHAESREARAFYEHLIPEWQRSPTDPMHLFLPMKDIRRTLQ